MSGASAAHAHGLGHGSPFRAADDPGAGGLLFHPYLAGERAPLWDSASRGAFARMNGQTAGPQMARAVLEGVDLRPQLESLFDFLDEDLEDIVVDIGRRIGHLQCGGPTRRRLAGRRWRLTRW